MKGFHVAVLVTVECGDAGPHCVGDRDIQAAGHFGSAVVTAGRLDPSAERPARRLGEDADRPTDGIAAEQSVLRPAQHLHALDVYEVHQSADRAAHIDPVEIDADGWINVDRKVALTNAANEHRGGA